MPLPTNTTMPSNFEVLFDQLRNHLDNHHLNAALKVLGTLSQGPGLQNLREETDKLSDDYGMMLEYIAQGFEDPERHRLYDGFVRRAREIADKLRRENDLTEGTSLYARTWNTLQLMTEPHTLPTLNAGTCSYRLAYEVVWTSGTWTAADKDKVEEWLTGEEVPYLNKCVTVSAVMTASLRHFDINKLRLLLDIYQKTEGDLRVRALTGFALICVAHPSRVAQYDDIAVRVGLLADDAAFRSNLFIIQTQLFLSLRTSHIEQHLREEILPEMMKQAEAMRRRGNLTLNTPEDLSKLLEIKPDWEQGNKDNGFMDKMNALIEMQQQGADIFIGTFKTLKQKYPFFSTAANWFCPFSKDIPEVGRALQKNALFGELLHNDQLCNSDKIAMALLLEDMAPAFGNMAGSMPEVFGNASGLAGLAGGTPPDEEQNIRSYMQDLYRYFNLFRYSDKAENPFSGNLLFIDNPTLSRAVNDESTLLRLADLSFNQGSYRLSRHLYAHVTPTATILQKTGYSLQRDKRYEEAAEAYEKALLFCDDDTWTLKNLGTCYRLLGQPKEALRHYRKAEQALPEDARLLLHIFECHLQLEDYAAAHAAARKANFLTDDSDDTLRALAWCDLLGHNTEQAEVHYQRLLANEPVATDYLNAGHSAWVGGNMMSAVSRYHTYLRKSGREGNFADILAADSELLGSYGLGQDDFCLMQDLLERRG